MKIRLHHTEEEDGEQVTRFRIKNEYYEAVLKRLRDSKFNPGGQADVENGESEIHFAGRSIKELNKAIQDIPGEQ